MRPEAGHAAMQVANRASGVVVQLVRTLPCHGRGRGFESRRPRHFLSSTYKEMAKNMEVQKGHVLVPPRPSPLMPTFFITGQFPWLQRFLASPETLAKARQPALHVLPA